MGEDRGVCISFFHILSAMSELRENEDVVRTRASVVGVSGVTFLAHEILDHNMATPGHRVIYNRALILATIDRLEGE